MNPTQILPPFTYSEPAISCFWPEHPYYSSISSHKITISNVMICDLVDVNSVSFLFNIAAGFNKGPVSGYYNQGPFIDILSFSIKPLNKNANIRISDSHPSTDVKNFRRTIDRGFSLQANLGDSPGLSLSINNRVSVTMDESEFEMIKHPSGEKEKIVCKMLVAYSRPSDPRNYDIDDITTLVRTKLIIPNRLRTPPSCATSSLGATWNLSYLFYTGPTQTFKWSTEVRAVFASQDDDEDEDFSEYTKWTKTVHKIVQTFEIKINADKTLSLRLLSRKIQRIYSHGFDYHTINTVQERQVIEF